MSKTRATNSEVDPKFYSAVNATSHYTGFPNRTDTSLSFNDGTYTLTLTAVNKVIWINGKSYTINTLTKQLSVAQEAVSGLYWFWLSVSGGVVSLNVDITAPGFDKCLVATVYWNTTSNKGILSDERHWMGRDKWYHEYLHQTVGARYYAGLTGTFTNTTFAITAGEFYDEDIEHKCSGDSPFAYPGSDITTCKNIYHNGSAEWVWDANSTTIYKAVAGVLKYNNGNTLTSVDNNKYVNYWVFITASTINPVHSFIGTNQYVNLADARAASVPSLGALASAENKIIYKVTYQNNGGTPAYIETTDYRTSSTLATSNFVPTAHSTLSGLTVDDHPQYFLVNGNRAMTGSPTIAYDIKGETKCWDVTITNPNGFYNLDTQIPVALVKSALTITKIQVSLNTTAQQVAGDLKYADDLTAFTNPVVINDFDTTSGVRTDTSITSGAVASGKWIYLQFDSQPNSAITWMIIHIEWDYD